MAVKASERLRELLAQAERIELTYGTLVDLWEALPLIADVVEAAERTFADAEHLFQMIPEQVWRDSGGDDGQGHYEGEYHAAMQRDALVAARAALTALRDALERP